MYRKVLIITAGLVILCCPYSICAEKDNNGVIDVDTITNAVAKGYQKAILSNEARQAVKKANEEQRVQEDLDAFLKQWIDSRRLERNSQLNKKAAQEWEKYISAIPYHMDYYIRDFAYSVEEKNIINSDSITYPYQARVLINEILYVEQLPLQAEPRKDYRYAANINVDIVLNYDKGSRKWQIESASEQISELAKGWPQSISSVLGLYFIPAD